MNMIINAYTIVGLMFFSAILIKLSMNLLGKLCLVLLIAAAAMWFDQPDRFMALMTQVKTALNY